MDHKDGTEKSASGAIVLNTAQKARMEKNRLKAITLQESKVLPRPFSINQAESRGVRIAGTEYRDTGGGFLLEESDAPPERTPVSAPAPLVDVSQQPHCEDCGRRFPSSFLYDMFEHSVCDACRDRDGRHALIPKTEAKVQFLLQECHLERMEPPLRYLERRNPHRQSGTSMRLYLRLQVERRAHELWGGAEGLSEELERREERRSLTAANKMSRDLRQLRRRVRPKPLRDLSSCTHQYEEKALGDDMYEGCCVLCRHIVQYEKM